MSAVDPTNLDEYNKRFMAAQEITGRGIEGTTMHMPCPFCCWPDWWVYAIIDMRRSMAEDFPKACGACGRSARFDVREENGGVIVEPVQTGGDPPPDFLPPMRRD